MPKSSGIATRLAQQAGLAQEAAARLARIESHLRIQTAIQERANDQDDALHIYWRRGAFASTTPGLAVIEYNVQDDSMQWELMRLAISRTGVGVLTAKAAYVCIGGTGPENIVEVITPAQMAVTIAVDGRNVAAYADAFANNVRVNQGVKFYVLVVVEGAENVTANIQVCNLTAYAEATIEGGHDDGATYVAPHEGRDQLDDQADVAADIGRRMTPDVFAEPPSQQPASHTDNDPIPGTQHIEQSGTPPVTGLPDNTHLLLPAYKDKLPPHLR